ncbi:MAG: DUF5361 domain-containing protein [Actinophytocola sp.]|uniref:DUF5361 domain-containing protein n=1 Tax=Actinophytocola sp. TaxID=1872138 RepID=UPI003D6A1CB7
MSPRRLWLLIEHLPADSAYKRASADDDWEVRPAHLLTLMLDQLVIANWQRSKDGTRGTNRPKPISPLSQPEGTRHGGTTLPQDVVIAHLKARGPQAAVA